MDKRDYEWHYYIGGNCSLKHRKAHTPILAYIDHIKQGVYEATIYRDCDHDKPISVGVFNNSNEAQEVIHQVLEPVWEKT